MRPLLLALVALLALSPAAFALGPVPFVLAHGTAHHRYETTGVCEADAWFAVELDATDPAAITILGDASTCLAPVPYFGSVGGCTGGPGTDVVCERDGATEHVRVLLARDGTFHLDWVGADFVEAIDGRLDRTDV